jgi:hypothetical protein
MALVIVPPNPPNILIIKCIGERKKPIIPLMVVAIQDVNVSAAL